MRIVPHDGDRFRLPPHGCDKVRAPEAPTGLDVREATVLLAGGRDVLAGTPSPPQGVAVTTAAVATRAPVLHDEVTAANGHATARPLLVDVTREVAPRVPLVGTERPRRRTP
ncbi:hypothetical protein [Streptomyces sp. NPDC054975]